MRIERQNPSKADVHHDLEVTRARMSETIDELEARISGKVAEVKHTVDPTTHVRAHPWPALAAALAAGVAIGATNGERKAAKAAVQGAKQAPGATAAAGKATAHKTADLAKAASEKVRGGSDDSSDGGAGSGLFGRLKRSIDKAVEAQTLVIVAEMERAARELVAAASPSGAPRDRAP